MQCDKAGFREGSALSIGNRSCMILMNEIVRTGTWSIVCGGFNIYLFRKVQFLDALLDLGVTIKPLL